MHSIETIHQLSPDTCAFQSDQNLASSWLWDADIVPDANVSFRSWLINPGDDLFSLNDLSGHDAFALHVRFHE
jgi:hypothetical protein